MGDKKDNPEAPLLLYAVWTAAHAVGGLLDRALQGSGLNADEFGFYSAVYENRPVTPAKIAEKVGMPATTVSSFLKRLIARGHISKVKNPSDGRSFLVELTPAGMAVFEEAGSRFWPAQQAVMAELGPVTERVYETLSRLTEAVIAATEQQGAPAR